MGQPIEVDLKEYAHVQETDTSELAKARQVKEKENKEKQNG
jgi:hypothetical protein